MTRTSLKRQAVGFTFLLLLHLLKPAMAQETEVLRTPESRFANIDDYPFSPNYVSIAPDLRMHYLDEGEKDSPVVLLLHGEPSWSYLYRHIIPPLLEEGYRVIAPDLVGFGKSDKPVNKEIHTYSNHTDWLTSFIKELGITKIHLYCHDWGGMIALRIVAERPELFSTVIASYAFLFTGKEIVPESFRDWQNFSQTNADFSAGNIINWGSHTELPGEVQSAYNAPFPDDTYKAGARRFPIMVPTDEDDPEAKTNALLREKLKSFNKPFLTIWGNHDDKMWQGKDEILQNEIPGAQNQDHKVLSASHFLQEDQARKIAAIIVEFLTKQ